MAHENKEKRLKRKFISLEDKIQILNRLKDGEKPSSVGKSLNLNEATIRTIQKNENKIRKSVAEGRSFDAKRVSRTRDIDMIRMENALMVWAEDCLNKKIPLSGTIIRQKALTIYKHLKQIGRSSTKPQTQSFTASKGWFEKLKKRFSLHNIKFQGEQASAGAEAAYKFTQELHEIVDRGEYTADQIFNADETALYWKKMPSRSYISKYGSYPSGVKDFKDRIKLVMCSNVTGNFMLKPMIIHHSVHSRGIKKNREKSQLPIFCGSNNKTWMRKGIFEDWFTNCFVPSVQNYMKEQSLKFKVLLLVDNAPNHSIVLSHPNVKILFFPPNSAPVIQPLDQGIIHMFKAYYIRQTFEVLLSRLETDKNKTLIQIWKEFSISDCVRIISSVCKEIKTSTLNAGWKALLPQMVKKENAISSVDLEYTSIINVASHLDGEGLADMNIRDVGELFQEETLSEEDLMEFIDKPIPNTLIDDNSGSSNSESISSLTLTDVQRGIDLGKQLELYFIEKDPSVVRSGKFKRELQSCLAPYQEILTMLQNDNTLVSTSNSFAPSDKITSNEEFQPARRKRD